MDLFELAAVISLDDKEYRKSIKGAEDAFKGLEDTAKKTADDVTKSHDKSSEQTKTKWQKASDNIKRIFSKFSGDAKSETDKIPEGTEKSASKFKDAWKKAVDKGKEFFKKFKKDGEETSTSLVSIFSGAAKKIVGALSAVAAVKAFSGLIKSSVDAYADFEQLTGGVETLFKDNADIVKQYAENAYKTSGLSANEYMETVTGFSAALITSLKGDTKKAAEMSDMAMTDMSDNANKMGSSMESIQNAYAGFAKGNYTMLDNLKLGYGGTIEEMKKLANDAQKISGIKYDISKFSDVVDAIHVIQTSMDITGTTAREASTTISGSVNMAKKSWTNLITHMADENADFGKLINNFIESVQIAADNLLPRIKQALFGVVELVEQMLPTIVKLIPQLFDGILEKLPQISYMLLKAALELIDGLLRVLKQSGPDFIYVVIQAALWMTQAILDEAPKMLKAAIKFFTAIVEALPDTLDMIIENLKEMLTTIIYGVLDAVPELLDAAIKLFKAIIDAIPVILEELSSPYGLPAIVENLIEGLAEEAPALLQAALELLNAIIEAIPLIIQILLPQVPTIVSSIVTALLSEMPLLLNAAVTLFMEIVKAIPTVIGSLLSYIPQFAGIGVQVVSSLVQGIRSVMSQIPGVIKGIITSIGSLFKQLVSQGKTWGKDFLQGFIDSIKSKITSLVSTIKGVADKIKSFLHFSRPDEGPLRDYETWMPDMMMGMASSLKKSEHYLIDEFENLAGGIALNPSIGMGASGVAGSGSFPTIHNTFNITASPEMDLQQFAEYTSEYITAKLERQVRAYG